MSVDGPENEPTAFRISDDLERGLDGLLRTGYYLNRTDVLRSAARTFLLEEPPLRDYRGPLGRVNDHRYCPRLPRPIIDDLDRLAEEGRIDSRGAGVRVGLAILADGHLDQYRIRDECAVEIKEAVLP